MTDSKTLIRENDQMQKLLNDTYGDTCGGEVAADAAEHSAAIGAEGYTVPKHMRGHGATVVDKKPRP